MIRKLKEKLKKQSRDGIESGCEKVEDRPEEAGGLSGELSGVEKKDAVEEGPESAKVVVVGHDETFSKAVIDYAVGFAERMGYEIVALNVGPITKPNTEALGPYCDLVRGQFEQRCKEAVRPFEEACRERGIAFRHVVKFGEVDRCIREVHDELESVEFVIADPESCPEDGKVAIPVFCMTKE